MKALTTHGVIALIILGNSGDLRSKPTRQIGWPAAIPIMLRASYAGSRLEVRRRESPHPRDAIFPLALGRS